MKKFKNILAQNIVLNLTYAVVTVIYFIFISMQYSKFNQIDLNYFINVSSLFFLLLSIVVMEFAYRKDDGITFITGIEFLIIAIFILLTQHMIKVLNCNIQVYTLVGANFVGLYYILKTAVLYTKEQKDKLSSLSDIKEIVKDEPVKKASKRRNKKIEEGK